MVTIKAALTAVVCLSVALRATTASSQPDVVLVGATGNLAKKYLWQILFDLHRTGKVGRIFAGATKPKDKGTGLINGIVNDRIKCSDEECEQARGHFRDTVVEYVQLRQNEQYGALAGLLDATGNPNRLFFLSVSPDFYPQIAKNINTYARPKIADAWLRVIFEKPFGRDAASAKSLADVLRAELAEEEVYRIDHYLGKQAVQSVGEFRRVNAKVLEPLWNREAIESVSVVMKEAETCEGRTGFYDRYGVIRDVLQNHLLELVAFIAADLPESSSPAAPIDRLSLLKQVQEAKVKDTILGQYEGYAAHVLEDSGGKTNSTSVPTAATVRLFIDNDRWRDVPFTLSAGKGLDERAAYVRVRFRQEQGKYARDDADGPCDVLMHLQGGTLGTATVVCKHLPAPKAEPGWDVEYGLNGGTIFKPERKAPNPYFVLISGAIDGRRDLFCGTEELHELWRVWTPLLAAIDEGAIAPVVLSVGQKWSAAEKMMDTTKAPSVDHTEL